jgi:hypothetical protein
MADPAAIVSTIKTYEPDLRQALGGQADPFFQQVEQLFGQAISNGADLEAQNRAGDALLALVDQYPAVAGLMRQVDPGTFGPLLSPAGPALPASGPPAPIPAPTEAPPEAPIVISPAPMVTASLAPAPPLENHPPDGPPAAPLPVLPPSPPVVAAPPDGNGAAPVAAPATFPPAPVAPALSATAPTDARPLTTPGLSVDDRLRTFKEQVSAVLGVLLVLGTVALAFVTAFRSTADYQQAKDVLLVLSGLAGVVLGYYFGRIPSDARADQAQRTAADAQQVAAAAQSDSRSLATQADHLADQVGAMVTRAVAQTGVAGSRGLGGPAADDSVAQLQALQAALRDLARRGRA